MPKSITLAVTFVLFGGVGLWNLWGSGRLSAEAIGAAQSRLDSVPMTIGDWEGKDLGMDDKTVKTTRARSWLNRSYTRAATGETVNVMLLYGDPGDLGAHDPKVCYGGIGFDMAGGYTKRKITGDAPHEFWSAKFEKPMPYGGAFEVWWGWGTEGAWRAPDSPRLAFAQETAIYKLYLQQSLNPARSETPLDNFLPGFLNELQKRLMTPNP